MNDTKDAIVAAYTHLVRSNRSAFPRINDLVRESGVARSTLYRHFDDRSAVLVEALREPFATLSDAARTGRAGAALTNLLEHFWAERRAVTDLLATPHVSRLVTELGQNLAAAIAGLRRDDALRVAHTQIGFLRLWVSGETQATPGNMARILATSSSALVATLREENGWHSSPNCASR